MHYLGAIGGKDVAETTRRILRCMTTNAVACRMNYAGRGSKTGICELKVLDVIIGKKVLFTPSRLCDNRVYIHMCTQYSVVIHLFL